MFEIETPRSTEEVRAELRKLHREITSRMSELSTEEFQAPQGAHWSPAQHIGHLVAAVRAVAQGLSTPKPLLALRFGVTFKGSRSFEEIRRSYRAALAKGAKAKGRYDPARSSAGGKEEDVAAVVMKRWVRVGEDLDGRVAEWSEKALDRLRAKHPLLGLMTFRELLFFTLYHNAHHARRINERRA